MSLDDVSAVRCWRTGLAIAAANVLAAMLMATTSPLRASEIDAPEEPRLAGPRVVLPSNPAIATTARSQQAKVAYASLIANSRDWTETLKRELAAGMEEAKADAPDAAKARMAAPARFLAFTSGFGLRVHPILARVAMHDGVDIGATMGTPVIATADGKVGRSGWLGGYGLLVSISHSPGLETRYGHLSRTAVVPGQIVRKGEVIGFVGSTGRSTGPHLHYEVRISGRPVDPMPYLQAAAPLGRR